MTAVTVESVSWRIGAVPIVDDVTLQLAAGEFMALIGPNGAGKTSLFNLISGLRRPSSGRILLDGGDVTGLAPYRRARLGLGRTFQTSAVFGSLTVAENVALAVQARRGGATRAWRRRSDRQVTARAGEILSEVRLSARASATAGSLAHGEKRKLEIALLLAGEPSVLLLDEPMAGVSAEEVPALVTVIRGLAGESDRSVLMVEHHMDVVLDVADRIAVLHHGALLACDTPDAVMADPFVQEAYLGESL
ncbi:branched-chain amino acid transport system ATP-binding protein [Actinoplanes campanulatus]|uniref:Branched-chain amino acid transport system ATP-binding protein n=1 Tax=Actinoplanes campanulatus TaxID=113559 RepID=A0A7W5FFL7_9ACTN|nr:ABC transporter ATP-binding protein [Actinoplanes campanulatus]MBB3096728.1 branched-chain amino acid transport system ATP-binding protein [Actinoplanes campanulatus]GGN30876.1 ABC transporter ATP-binding protein [Actinoplanes campanulatus]GID37271.1 ABC transporter ATP-binding protein [Actinoplanes campanulatus]